MMFGVLAMLAVSLYLVTPGDGSGKPYPNTIEDMRKELKEMEQLLADSEKGFLQSQAYTQLVCLNNPYLNRRIKHFHGMALGF
jgi:hypothetical protein